MKITWAGISEGTRYFFVGIMGLISATDLIPVNNVKLYVFILSAAVVLLKSIDIVIKMRTNETNKTNI